MAGNCMRTANGDLVTTEWEDVQHKFGNEVGKYATHAKELEEQRLRKLVEDVVDSYDPLEHRSMKELDEMLEQDGLGDDDEAAIVRFRELRRREMLEQQQGKRHGSVRHITKSEYVAEVSNASEDVWVVCLLFEEGHQECDALRRALGEAAELHPAVKFVTIRSTDAIEKFPRRNLPTVLLYHGGEMKRQLVGMDAWGGGMPSADDVQTALRRLGPLRDARRTGDSDDDDEEEEETERGPAASGPAVRGGGRSRFSIL
eukprot:TRINITY_DN1932_c0_g1_i1.p1 TRINITY_DN1932_c0_g1~~TRINITY_DN1932_c0_g1_i1.p1  ORF type:complete len:258 (+),score=112.58 TRINITY_DN1932_c0_g1_i1:70-843(+)